MLRVLLIILSVVAIILAYALQQWVLAIAALAFLAASATLTTVKMKKRHDDVPESFMKAPEAPIEDLGSLGILEIKPVSQELVQEESASTTESEAGDVVEEVQQELEFGGSGRKRNVERPKTISSDSAIEFVGEVRTRKPKARIMVAEVGQEQDADVLIPALRSLRAGLGAYTVCLLRQENAPLRYHVEAIVSQNSYARSQGSFAANRPLHSGFEPLSPIVYTKVGEDGYPLKRLGYYHEPISVRQVAMVAVTSERSHSPYVLVVDTMLEGGLESESAGLLLEQYARLIATLLESAAKGDLKKSIPSQPRKSRREIIQEEMRRARNGEHSLALALIYLNRGEELGETAVQDLHELESAFEARLREIADNVRVEQFGELTFGVFYHGELNTVANWASSLQSSFVDERGQLRGGVSVGVAILQSRHKGPDDLRSDATAALQEAFESGSCTIVE